MRMGRFFPSRKSRIIDFDPQNLGFIQYPEFFWQPGQDRRATAVISGNWDREIDQQIYWSGKYEKLDDVDFGMIPLNQYVFFVSARDHFLGDVPWDDTMWLKFMRNRKDIKRYETEENIQERLNFLEQLFNWFRSGRVEIFENDMPTINIGCENRISLDDGRHRLCMAVLAGLREIPVRVKTVHPGAANSKYASAALGGRGNTAIQYLKSSLMRFRSKLL